MPVHIPVQNQSVATNVQVITKNTPRVVLQCGPGCKVVMTYTYSNELIHMQRSERESILRQGRIDAANHLAKGHAAGQHTKEFIEGSK